MAQNLAIRFVISFSSGNAANVTASDDRPCATGARTTPETETPRVSRELSFDDDGSPSSIADDTPGSRVQLALLRDQELHVIMERMENLPYEDREQNIRRVWDKVAALCAEANASIADFFVSMTGETCELMASFIKSSAPDA